ncbi:MAG: GNAT family N-acetyltransferase [Pseudobdellovibrio sp.]
MLARLGDFKDHDSILQISEQIYQNTQNKAYYNWPKAKLFSELEVATSLVLELDHQIVSFICYRDMGDVFEISVLATSLQQQKKAYQQRLLEFLMDIAAKQRRPIFLEVHSQNQNAVRLYQKMGFILVNVRKKYYSDLSDALVMKWQSE